MKINPACHSDMKLTFGLQKPLPHDMSFLWNLPPSVSRQINSLVPAMAWAVQLLSCLLQITSFTPTQEKTQNSYLPVPMHRLFRKFFFKMSHRYMNSRACLCGSQANIQKEQVASVAHLCKLLLNLVFLSRNHCSKRRKKFGVMKSAPLRAWEESFPHIDLRHRFLFPFSTCWESA